MSDTQDKILAGQEAARIEGLLRPFVEKRIHDVLDRIDGAYNNPEASSDLFFGYAAELSALRGLLKDLNITQRNGVRALQKEVQHAS